MEIPAHIAFTNLFLFIIAVIGLTNVIVDGVIFNMPREWIKTYAHPKIYQLISCYQCAGMWCGFFMGLILISYHNPFVIFACGCAGSFLSAAMNIFLTYLEARSIVDLDLGTNDEQKISTDV